jgi:hypothetical protein
MPRYSNGSVRHPGGGSYRQLRRCVTPDLAAVPDAVFDSVLERAGIDAHAAESLLSGLLRVAPAALSMFGPIGTIAGGALSGILGRSGNQAPAQPPPAQPPAPGQAAPSLPAQPAVPAMAQLLQLLSRPEVLRSLLGAILPGGAPAVPVGGTQVPVSAITNTIAQLAQQATAEYESHYGHLTNANYVDAAPGTYDEANPVSRANAVLRLFAQEDLIRMRVARARRPLEVAESSPPFELEDQPEGWSERDFYEASLLAEALSDLEA